MTLISTTTLTGASVTLSSIPATYNNLRVVIRGFSPVSDGERLLMRFNADSTANRHAFAYTNSANIAAGTATTFARTSIILSESVDISVNNNLCIIDIEDYTNTTTWKMARYETISNDFSTTTSFIASYAIGLYNQTAAISSLQFLFDGVNADAGTILLYGVK
jgi:glutathionylspermidine synthase